MEKCSVQPDSGAERTQEDVMLTKWGKTLDPSNILPEVSKTAVPAPELLLAQRLVGVCVYPVGYADAAASL
jgi:hypothetical protein